jgi:hypothetical protein
MRNKTSNVVSSRRQFLKNVLPAGTIFCFGCSNLLAMPISEDKKKASTEKHKFLEDSGMTVEEVFKLVYQESIPILQNLANDIGREKFIEMLKKASSKNTTQGITDMTKNLPKKDMAALADFLNGMVNTFPYNKALTYEITEKTDKVFEIKFTECLFAKILREMNAADIGYAFLCYPTGAFARAFNPKIKGTHPKTLMQGHDVCIERFVWEG